MHQVPMHIFLEHFCVDKVFTAKLIHLLFTNEFILVVNYFFFLLLQLFSDVFNVGYPFWGWTKLRHKETTYFWILKCCKNHSTIWHNCTHVNTVLWLNTGKEMTFAVCYFYLLFIAEDDVFIVIVQKMD